MDKLVEMLMGQQNQSNVSDIMEKFGLDEDQARQAIGALLPGVTKGIQEQAVNKNDSILQQLANAQQERYLDDDDAHLYDPESIDDGTNVLSQIFGSKDVSRSVAGQAAQQTGLDSGILKQLLPMVASMAMGAVGKQVKSQGAQDSGSGLMDLVTSMLGGGQGKDDGFGLDDVMGIASKFFR